MKTISIKKKYNRRSVKKTKYQSLVGGNRYCSPKNSNNKSYTCLSYESLKKIAKSINKTAKSTRIKTNSKKNIIWNSIKNHFQDKCKNEWCWIQQETIKRLNDTTIINSFLPEMPSSWLTNSREWLSTLDIENVMEQYQDNYKEFLFIGPVPIDFDSNHQLGGCVVDELCNLNISNL